MLVKGTTEAIKIMPGHFDLFKRIKFSDKFEVGKLTVVVFAGFGILRKSLFS